MTKKLTALGIGILLIVILDLLMGLLPQAGSSAATEDPFMGFSGTSPVFTRYQSGNGGARLRTAQNKLKWFNSQDFAAHKPDNSYRIFTLGGSTTYGRPYSHPTSFSAWMERLLEPAGDGLNYEVINAGGISYASYRVKVVLEEILDYEPDLVVIYTGHNEFLESRTYPELQNTSEWSFRLGSLYRRTNTYKVLKSAISSFRDPQNKQPTADSGRSVLGAEVETMLDKSAGLELYQRDSVYSNRVFRHFRYNVAAMIELCSRAGVDVVFCSPVDNLKDFSPFKSTVAAATSSESRLRLQRLLDEGQASLAAGQTGKATAIFQEAIHTDSLYALSHFMLGRALLAEGDTALAAPQLHLARELDVCPLRAQDAIHAILEQETGGSGAGLIDLPAVFGRHSPGGLTGNELLMDHIHPTPEANLIAAREIVAWMAANTRTGQLSMSSLPEPDALLRETLDDLDADYFQTGILNLAKVLVWAGKYGEVNSLLGDNPKVLESSGEARYLMGVVLEKLGRPMQAAQYYAGALEAMPSHLNSMNFLAGLYSRTGQLQQAEQIYRRALEQYPNNINLLSNYGILLAHTGRRTSAGEYFRKGLEAEPQNTTLLNNLGLLHLQAGEQEKAMEYFGRTLAVQPRDPQANNLAGVVYMMSGRMDSALVSLSLAAEANPENPSIRTNLGNVYRKLDRMGDAEEQFRLALMLSRENPDHFFNLAMIYRERGKSGKCNEVLSEGLEKYPENRKLISLQQQK